MYAHWCGIMMPFKMLGNQIGIYLLEEEKYV